MGRACVRACMYEVRSSCSQPLQEALLHFPRDVPFVCLRVEVFPCFSFLGASISVLLRGFHLRAALRMPLGNIGTTFSTHPRHTSGFPSRCSLRLSCMAVFTSSSRDVPFVSLRVEVFPCFSFLGASISVLLRGFHLCAARRMPLGNIGTTSSTHPRHTSGFPSRCSLCLSCIAVVASSFVRPCFSGLF